MYSSMAIGACPNCDFHHNKSPSLRAVGTNRQALCVAATNTTASTAKRSPAAITIRKEILRADRRSVRAFATVISLQSNERLSP